MTDKAKNTAKSAINLNVQEDIAYPPLQDGKTHVSSHFADIGIIQSVTAAHLNPPGLLTGTAPTVPTTSWPLIAVEEN